MGSAVPALAATPDPVALLTVDLDAVAANWRLLCRQHPGGDVAGVLKADGYGMGAGPVASRLHREGCRVFFTAHLDEAVRVRPLVPGATVAVLNGLWPGWEREYVEQDCVPVLGSLAEVRAWGDTARTLGRALPAFLHVDTGMNRLGLPAAELDALAADPALLGGINVLYVMTHLAAADENGHALNLAQPTAFAAACARLPPARTSLANSSGIFRGLRSDLARPGAALYGINPTPGLPNPMRSCVRLEAKVLQVRDIAVGETVGYNGTWAAPVPARIATVSVGYADGWLRSLSNAAHAYFDGQPIPLVGRVSMDLTTFDVTRCPQVQRGDWLELMGPHQGPDAIAAAAGTNGYEILTSLARRFRRTYLGA